MVVVKQKKNCYSIEGLTERELGLICSCIEVCEEDVTNKMMKLARAIFDELYPERA